MKITLTVLLALFSCNLVMAAAAEPTPDEILKKATQNVYAKSEESTYVMRLVDAEGKESVRKMRIWFRRDNEDKARLLIKFQEPADIRGTGLLNIIEKGKPGDQWLYLPAVKKVRRIKGGNDDEAFLGSDFTTGDLSVDSKHDFEYKTTGTVKCGAEQCWEITGLPKADVDKDSVPYSKKVLLVRKDSIMATRTDFYNRDGKLEKTLTLEKVHQDSAKHWLADQMTMKNVLTNHSTVIEVQKRDTSKVPADSVFTQSYLERN